MTESKPEIVICPFTGNLCEKGCVHHNSLWDTLLEKFGYDRAVVNSYLLSRVGKMSAEDISEFKASNPNGALICKNIKDGKR